MKVVRSTDAEEHLPQLLDEVEQGEIVVITRNGNRIARIVPEAQRDADKVRDAIEAIKLFGRQSGTIAVSEILSARDEGRRH